MAEALAVIGFIGSVTQLVTYGVKVIERLNEFNDKVKGLPETFDKIHIQLPLLLNVVDNFQTQASRGELAPETERLLHPVLRSLRKEIEDFDTTLLKILPSPQASQREKISKAFKSINTEKKLDEFRSSIQYYLNTLSAVQDVRHSDSLRELLEFLKAQKTDLSKAPVTETKKKPVWMVRYDLEEDFVGRDDLMHTIDAQLCTKNRRVALAGIGGVGKSRIAIQYCYRYRQRNPGAHVFWVYAGSRSRFTDDYRKIARLLDLPGRSDPEADVLRLVTEWLSDEVNGPWLMVLDNADDREIWLGPGLRDRKSGPSSIPLIDHLPRCYEGQLLMTTRDRQLGHRLGEGKNQPLDVTRLAPSEARQLLSAKLHNDDELESTDVDELTRELEYLPLTITQAAAYLEQTEITASEYLEIFRTGQSDIPGLLEESIDDPSRDREGSNSVFQTWKISFHQIQKQSPKAADMLSLMAVLDRQAISRGLLRALDHNEIEHKAAIAKLKAFSLIHEEDSSARYTLHRLVQLSTRGWLSDHGKLSPWQASALHAVAQEHPTDVTFENWPLIQDLSSHFQAVLTYSIDERQALLNRAQILHCFGYYTMEQGQPGPAMLMLEESHALREKHVGKEKESTLETLGLLGLAHSRLNHIKLACSILVRFHEAAERALGPRHRLTLKGMSRLAVTYEKQGRTREGRDLLLRALSLTEETFGATSEDTIRLLTNLAYCYNRLCQWRDAEEVALRAMKLRVEQKGEDHPDTLTIMGSLAWTLRAQSRFQEAEQLESKALRRRLEVLGVDHPKTRHTMTSLAELLGLLERWQDAEKVQRQVVEIKQRIEGSEQWASRRAKKYLDMLQQALHNPEYRLVVKNYLEYNNGKMSGAKMNKPKQKSRNKHNHSNSTGVVTGSQDPSRNDCSDLRDKRLALREIGHQLANRKKDPDQYDELNVNNTATPNDQTASEQSIHQLREQLAAAHADYRLAAKNLGLASPQPSASEEGDPIHAGAISKLSRGPSELEDSPQVSEDSRRSQQTARRNSADSMATLVEPESSMIPGW